MKNFRNLSANAKIVRQMKSHKENAKKTMKINSATFRDAAHDNYVYEE